MGFRDDIHLARRALADSFMARRSTWVESKMHHTKPGGSGVMTLPVTF